MPEPEEDHPADYTGVHAFVLIDQVEPGKTPEDVVAALRALGKPPIMYASAFVGDFVAFAHVRARNIRHLQDLMADPIWNAGARCSWHTESPDLDARGEAEVARLDLAHQGEDATRDREGGAIGARLIAIRKGSSACPWCRAISTSCCR